MKGDEILVRFWCREKDCLWKASDKLLHLHRVQATDQWLADGSIRKFLFVQDFFLESDPNDVLGFQGSARVAGRLSPSSCGSITAASAAGSSATAAPPIGSPLRRAAGRNEPVPNASPSTLSSAGRMPRISLPSFLLMGRKVLPRHPTSRRTLPGLAPLGSASLRIPRLSGPSANPARTRPALPRSRATGNPVTSGRRGSDPLSCSCSAGRTSILQRKLSSVQP